MTDHSNVDAGELWQRISNYAQGGHVLEVTNYTLSKDGRDKIPDVTFWEMDNKGDQIGWPKREEIEVLVKEVILEPDSWQDTPRHERATRRYNLTDEGRRLAALSRDEVLTYLAGKNIRRHPPVQMKWE